MTKTQVYVVLVVLCAIATRATSGIGHTQVIADQVVDMFTTDGKWLQDIYVSPNSPAQRGGHLSDSTTAEWFHDAALHHCELVGAGFGGVIEAR